MKKELYTFVSNFVIFYFYLLVLFLLYVFFGLDYLEKHKLIATFFDTVLSVYHHFNGFFIFFILVYFIFLAKHETRIFLSEYKGYLFKRFYPFVFLFFIIGIIFMFIFNSIMSFVFAQRSEYKYNYERYNFLAGQASEIVNEINNIDINLSSNKTLDINELIEVLKQKRKYLEELLKIYEKIRLIADNDELSINYYLARSEYDRMPIYDVDLEKVRKTVKTYPIKNLTKRDFQAIVNSFISKGDYSTANYFAYMGFASTKDDEFIALLDLTFKAINEYKNIEMEKKSSIFEEKQKNFLYLNTEKFKPAYYGFLKLHDLFPNDHEILSYKNKSLEKLKNEYFFFDEIEKYYENYGINDIFLFQPDSENGIYDYIYMQKVVDTVSPYLKMIKNFELIRFNSLGNIILHIKVPFATLKGNGVYQNVLDKKDENSDVTSTRMIVSLTDFDLSDTNIIRINNDVNNLHLFANSGQDGIFLPIQLLLGAFNRVKTFNLMLISVFSSSLFLMMSPILLVFFGILFIAVASKVNFEFKSKFMVFLLSAIIAVFSGIIALFINYLLLVLISLFLQVFADIYMSFILICFILFLIGLNVMRVHCK
ncbi:Hypothetical protein BCO_0079800 [Borrelia coriaceae ATCC 43381]|uniref:Uncharacterized protein n=1 Tax=Borrelia coriaceae ATCC 43381 TaxID=1408429 RepID=W5SUC7_9SPIR|nr:hypothetical protein [Borrelia coriaceae]AHH10525.1 Hypothetical protein BCO_0079800 [Borrelia coriaceae ATCC 43381]